MFKLPANYGTKHEVGSITSRERFAGTDGSAPHVCNTYAVGFCKDVSIYVRVENESRI
jgi:hypothetical protein